MITMPLEGTYTVFEQTFLLLTKSEPAVNFVYNFLDSVNLPEVNSTWIYDMYWRKQAGLRDVPMRIFRVHQKDNLSKSPSFIKKKA